MAGHADTIRGYWAQFAPYADDLRTAIVDSLTHLTAGIDDIVAIGLMSDSDASTLVPVAETGGHLRANQSRQPELAAWFGWAPDEWQVQPDGSVATADVMRDVAAITATVPSEGFLLYTTAFYDWVVMQLAELTREGVLDQHFPGANVVLWVTDEDMPEENTIEWLEQLNPPERFAEYAAWLRSNQG